MEVRLYHPILGVTITVPEGAAWVRLRNGWQYVVADPVPAEQAPEPILYREAEHEEATWPE